MGHPPTMRPGRITEPAAAELLGMPRTTLNRHRMTGLIDSALYEPGLHGTRVAYIEERVREVVDGSRELYPQPVSA